MNIYLDEFETLYGISDNIEDLRKKILELAFKGKFGTNKNYKLNAKELLESIRTKRKEMIENKEIRKPRGGVDPVNLKEVPFNIPEHWEWDKIGYIFNIYNGDSINRKLKERKYMKVSDGYNYIGTKDVGYYGEIQYNTGVKIPFDEEDFSIAPPNRPLICCEGGSAGKKIGFTEENISFGNKLFAVESFGDFNYKYLFYYYQSDEFYEQFSSKLKGIIGGVSMGRFREIYIPVPPLEEQKEIVERIEYLMEQVNELEEKLEEKEDISEKLSESVVEAISNSKDGEELKENLKFIISNLDVIFKTPQSMQELRNVVLQLAIEGKLVEQDPADEPASELIKRIEKEKERLITEGEIKKSRSKIKEIKDEDIPFDIPESWEWIKLCNIAMNNGQKTPENKFSYIDVNSINNKIGEIKSKLKVISGKDAPSRARKIVYQGDLIYSTVRPYLLNIAIIDRGFDEELIASTAFYVISKSLCFSNKYLYYYLKSKTFNGYVEKQMRGVAYPAINDTKLGNGIVPLPPLKEQKRIVEKVDSIMKIIDRLEEELTKKCNLVEKLGAI